MDGTETGWGRPAEPAPRWRALLDRARHGSRTAEEPRETDEDAEAAATPPPIRQAPPSAQPLPSRRPVEPRSATDPFPPAGGMSDLAPRGLPDLPQRWSNGASELPSRRPNGDELPSRRPNGDELPQRRVNGGAELPQRPVNPLAEPPRAIGGDVPRPLDRRPMNPLDRRPRPPVALPPAPAPESRLPAPLEPRRPNRLADGLHSRGGDAGAPHSFFNPATRAAPAQPASAPPSYPPARAAGSAAVVQPAPAPAAPPAPTSPAPARIEWRQAQPDQDTDRAIALMRRKLGSPRVLAFANPKGGVHKTTATVLAAATIGSVRGRGVLAWDDNELRGTLGLRAGSARHARTIRHLVGDLLTIENLHGDELLQQLDDYLRHASDGSYDVLAGEENPRFAQRLDQSTVRRVMDMLRRTHDVICVDTGNNVESVNWQTVMQAADQLVVTTVPREDAAFTADWMLDLLDETGMEDLVKNAVTLISCPSPGPLPILEDLKKHFSTRTRAVAVVPYDPALEVGSSIEYADLLPETRAAWMRAASTMIEPFAQ